jgi:hypothetical protein
VIIFLNDEVRRWPETTKRLDAPGRSPGTCRRHHREVFTAPPHLELSSVSPSSLILRVFVFNCGSTHAWVTPLLFDSEQVQEGGHGEDGENGLVAMNRWRHDVAVRYLGMDDAQGEEGTFWPRRVGHVVPSGAPDGALQKGTFSPYLVSHDWWSSNFFWIFVTCGIDFAYIKELLQLDFVENQRQDCSVVGIDALDVWIMLVHTELLV